ncbi:Hermansky-Pudlak syndrome 5 protein isoform X2 [Willisornis vidua]|uniref:Hermansky-Pudlak syndrome 5 protein homolog n=1 Tax=Willisornis vidua TaxID=1566151 RepID=A0ABQ9D596_9PASS|nr:Hermansky-Pudlak syndrome 5 protein isoform X2 [Willisornis vidua]
MASVPVIPDSYNHVLAELECLDPLLSALRLDSSRLKCTCIDVSKRWLALGSSGGGLNLIQKDGWKQRLFLTHKEGAISRVACCLHDEDYVAVATSQGLVVVWELNQERRGKPERIYVSSEHKGRKVTALCWDTAALRVFVGDHVGKVSAIKINTSKQGKARKNLPLDKLEHLKSQLDATTQQDLITQLEELISKLEPLDSACSSRRSSISSHESFSVLDSGIYRVISRRGSQSDEDSCSLHSQTFSEDERLKEFPAHQEDEQVDLDNVSHASVVVETDRNETFLPFSIPLSFRSPSPLVQAVKESVSSFVRKTTEKIGTLHISPDARGRQEAKDDEQLPELTVNLVPSPQEEKEAKLQDPLVLLEPQSMRRVLQEWLFYLEEKFSSKEHSALSSKKSKAVYAEEQRAVLEENLRLDPAEGDPAGKEQSSVLEGCVEKENTDEICPSTTICKNSTDLRGPSDCSFQVSPPCVIEPGVQKDLVELTTLCFELRVFSCGSGEAEESSDGSLPLAAPWTWACRFMRSYFFLLDLKRVKQCIITTYATSPHVWETYIAGLKELTCHSPVALAMEGEEMLKILKLLHDLGPWDDSPLLLIHAQRLYEKFGETALRPLIKFYPSLLPSDIKQLCRNDPAHFLAYLDSLVKSKPEDKRPSLLRSLLQPESLRLDWLCLAVSHDAPQRADTVDAEGNPRPRSHLFTWGYSQLILLLIKLPADFVTKEKMAHICKSHGFWPGYLFLCLELDRRIEAFTNIAHLDDLSLLNGEDGCIPETIEEWKFLLHLAQNHSTALHHHSPQNGSAVSNGGPSCPDCITVENVALLLARAIGPNHALPLLQECGLTAELSERFSDVCEILRVAEKRQRLGLGTMRLCVCLLLLSVALCVSADRFGLRRAGQFVRDAAGGSWDMFRAYRDMREANFKGADKYFHARGNYDAARRGPGGAWAARVISDAREGWQSSVSGRGAEDTRADQEANEWGRRGGNPNRYRPKGLPSKY